MLISAVGCTISAVCGFYCKWALLIWAVFLIIGLIITVLKKNSAMVTVIILILIMTLVTFVILEKIQDLNRLTDMNTTAEICYLATTYKSNNYYRSEFEVIDGEIPKGTRLSLGHSPFYCDAGEIIRANITLEEIHSEYKASNYAEGIYISGKINSFERTNYRDSVLSAVEKLQNYIRKWLFGNMSYESAATMTALVFGDKGYFSIEFSNNVKASGVSHVMVVSGMHLSVIVALLLKITEGFIYNGRVRAAVMLLTVLGLCTLCGFTKSILRAGVTYVIMAAGILIKRPYSAENSLGGAVTFILTVFPFTVFSIGFQLSVLSTFGILAVALPVCDYLKNRLKGILKGLCESAVLSLSAMLMTLPVVIYVFGYISTVGVITNLFISLPVSLCLCVAVAALIISPLLPFIASVLLNLCDMAVRYINFVINYFGSLKFSVVEVGKWGTVGGVALIFLTFKIMLACKVRADMLKLKEMNEKIISERGSVLKWRLFLKKN